MNVILRTKTGFNFKINKFKQKRSISYLCITLAAGDGKLSVCKQNDAMVKTSLIQKHVVVSPLGLSDDPRLMYLCDTGGGSWIPLTQVSISCCC